MGINRKRNVVALYLFFALTVTFIVLSVKASANASSEAVTVKDQAELLKTVNNKNIQKILLATDEKTTITIPANGRASKKVLIIDAPNAEIINKGVFKSITVKNVGTYNEKASGNIIGIKADGVVFKLYKGKNIKKLTVYGKDTKIYAGKASSVNELICAKKTSGIMLNASKGASVNILNKKSAFVTVTGSSKASVTINGCPDITETRSVEQYTVDYWRKSIGNDKEILSTKEIKAVNEENRNNGCGIVDLSTDKEYTAENVKAMIEDYSFPSKEYIHDRKITDDEKNAILKNRNLETNDFEVRYGITTENGSIRAFPSDVFLTNEKNLYDYLQETGINYGEPLIVLWESSDKAWYFVQAYDYNGWIRKDSVGLCDKETFDTVVKAFSDGDVWCPKKTGETEFVTEKDGTVKKTLRMGTYITVSGKNLLLPERDSNGNAYFVKADEPADKDGKLMKFTTSNLLDLCEAALGTPYSWGDIDEKGMDCSSTLQSIYRCFGILLPRNSSQQIKTAFEKVSLQEISKKEKYEILAELPTGTVLYMPGHVMLYLGMYERLPYVIQNTTDSARDDGGVTVYNACVLTSLENGVSGNTLFDRITYAVIIHA